MEEKMNDRFSDKPFIFFMLFVVTIAAFSGCSRENFFKQPKLKILSVQLLELPTDTTKLSITAKVINLDRKAAVVKKIDYTVSFPDDDVVSEMMTYEQDLALAGNDNVTQTFPLTITTEGAGKLLKKLVQGQTLAYQVQGDFVVHNAIAGTLTLPVDVSGDASVEIGYESFFEQPQVVVDNYVVEDINWGPPPFYLPPISADLKADITVTNMSAYSATITEVQYLVKIEGTSATQYETYGDEPAEAEFIIGPYDNDPGNPSDTKKLTALPFTMPATVAALFAGKLGQDVEVDFEVIGTIQATVQFGLTEIDFSLPLHAAETTTVHVPAFSIP